MSIKVYLWLIFLNQFEEQINQVQVERGVSGEIINFFQKLGGGGGGDVQIINYMMIFIELILYVSFSNRRNYLLIFYINFNNICYVYDVSDEVYDINKL